ncbi:MAG TPA: response regulator transcription factor [Verrucomicrobiae bacterium]|jgi:DNA-binding NarL/FixJ family response regulator|nr:response regulator transcription factor [Verrucomicrobiae bacterium]
MPIRILLADDHLVVREGLRSLLEVAGFKVVGEARDGREALKLARMLEPEVTVMDIGMPGLNGVDACRELLREVPEMRIIVLTVHGEDAYVIEALRSGARGYVLKTQAGSDLVRAIGEVTQGRIYLSPSVSSAVVQAFLAGSTSPADPLTPREREVLQLVAEGRSTKEVAGILGVSVKTAETHRTRLMTKLDIHHTAGLVHYAIRRGLIRV